MASSENLPALLRPTTTSRRPRPPPFAPSSLVWPAFFGGVLPAFVLSVVQARRLGATAKEVTRIVAVAVLAAAALLAVAVSPGVSDGPIRLLHRGLGFLVYLGGRATLRSRERIYDLGTQKGHASLWAWGLGTVLVLGTLENVALYLLHGSRP